MFIPLKMVLIGIDPYPYINNHNYWYWCFFYNSGMMVRINGKIPVESETNWIFLDDPPSSFEKNGSAKSSKNRSLCI